MTDRLRSGQVRIYLAGPMSGIADFNYPQFNATAEQLRAKGFIVENPAENPVPQCGTWAGYMRLAIPQLLTCDMIALLPGWSVSKGARLEFDIATRIGMPTRMVEDLLQEAV
ncbi:DUF4406 domain-containing protein [Methylomonas sp. MS20]|uniref:DUF4406 domain-containing protein n=1 Tax=unclassified Methylomonas TaxID=2608980 RepID=UPI0028A3DACB|nr:DUF4406 domain-containing protein [Methylomonas sp. MV1]MDT4328506.1 DUF4406 domain-containing protein [Methylomonas sp. MV1]